MHFYKIDDDPENQIYERCRIHLPEGLDFDVFLLKNIYSYSVVGMYSHTRLFNFNYTCGDDMVIIKITQQIVMDLIQKGMPIKDFLHDSQVRPWIQDEDFTKWLKSKMAMYVRDGK